MIGPGQLQSSNPDHGFQFPGEFELSAMGAADAGLDTALPAVLEAVGVTVLRDRTDVRASSAGRYVSVRIGFRAESPVIEIVSRKPDQK